MQSKVRTRDHGVRANGVDAGQAVVGTEPAMEVDDGATMLENGKCFT